MCSKYDTCSRFNSQHNLGGGGVWPFNEHESLHFDNKQDIHICSVYYEERVYAVDLELLAISY